MRPTVRGLESKVYNVKVCHAIEHGSCEMTRNMCREQSRRRKSRPVNIIVTMLSLSSSEMTSFGKCMVCLVLNLTTYFSCGGEYYTTTGNNYFSSSNSCNIKFCLQRISNSFLRLVIHYFLHKCINGPKY